MRKSVKGALGVCAVAAVAAAAFALPAGAAQKAQLRVVAVHHGAVAPNAAAGTASNIIGHTKGRYSPKRVQGPVNDCSVAAFTVTNNSTKNQQPTYNGADIGPVLGPGQTEGFCNVTKLKGTLSLDSNPNAILKFNIH